MGVLLFFNVFKSGSFFFQCDFVLLMEVMREREIKVFFSLSYMLSCRLNVLIGVIGVHGNMRPWTSLLQLR